MASMATFCSGYLLSFPIDYSVFVLAPHLSGTCSVTSGVPQGSVIGCLLFNLYINDITDSLDSTTTSKIFADDLKIYTELSSTDSISNLQNHLNLIHLWSVTWQLQISHSKCHTLTLGPATINQNLFISQTPISVTPFHCWPWHHHWPWFKFQKTHPWHCCTSQTTGCTHTSMLHFTQTSPPCQSLYCICPTSLGICHSSLVSPPCLSHQSPWNCPTRVYKAHPWFLELVIRWAFE